MAWDTELVNMLRFYINDYDEDCVYADYELTQYIAIAASWVTSEIDFAITWTIDTSTPSISPDPTASTYDDGIGNLFVLKAACIILLSEIKKDMSKLGIKIKDDVTEYDSRDASKIRQTLYQNYCANYDKAEKMWNKNNRGTIRAIFGSFSQANFLADNQLANRRSSIFDDTGVLNWR